MSNVILHQPVENAWVEGKWIWYHHRHRPGEMITCFFRRTFDAAELSDRPVMHISADSRYRAYINGRLVSRGPCRGTPDHYRYETVEVGDLLVPGRNVLAVEVRWYGQHAPVAEAHLHPGLWVNVRDGAGELRLVTDRDAGWKVLRSAAHDSEPIPPRKTGQYSVVDPCEHLDLRKWPLGWTDAEFDDSDWPEPAVVMPAYGKYQPARATEHNHELEPRPIEPMEETPIEPKDVFQAGRIELSARPADARCIDGLLEPTAEKPALFWGEGAQPWRLERPGTDYAIINMGKLVTGYLRLEVEAPAGSVVELRYAEALSVDGVKADREDPAGTVEGYFDTFICRQGVSCIETFIWRTWRYVRIAIHHPDGPAKVRKLETTFTAYPFDQRATFESSDPLHRRLWEVSWWTARLCAHEHYEDCPYYEQLQYTGDTRLQAMISYLVAGDFRLAAQAIRQYGWSQREDGAILSRTPSAAWEPQIITTFQLIWIQFIEDYYLYSGETMLASEMMPRVRRVLEWFEMFETDGLLRDVPYWTFTDWSIRSERHNAGSDGDLNMRYVGALQSAARLAAAVGSDSLAAEWNAKATAAAAACRQQLFNADKGLFADTLEGDVTSEHPSLLAILYDVVDEAEARQLVERIEASDDLARTLVYYTYYKFRAYEKLGLYERAWQGAIGNYIEHLDAKATTWFEGRVHSRSDCHAWGSWIMVDLLTAVLGVTPAEPGFARVTIRPQPMGLSWARGSVPTVRGEVKVSWRREGDAMEAEVELPPGVTGTFIAPDGSEHVLHGRTTIRAGERAD
jgi:hypothetical protein